MVIKHPGHADARAPLGTAQPIGKTPPEADTSDDASLNKRMFADRDLSPRISQNITDALMSRVILPGLAALPTHENIPKQGAASQEQFLEWSAMHFDNATAGEARRAFALTLAATFERHLRRWMFRHKTPNAGKMTFDALLAAGLERIPKETDYSFIAATLSELVLVGNVLRHGNGRSVTALRHQSPDLWHDTPEEDHPWLEDTYLHAELMRVDEERIRRYGNAIVQFWGAADELTGTINAPRY
jgi:hypothetical protein